MIKVVIIILILILIYVFIKRNKKEDFSNIKYSNGYFIVSDSNKQLYQDYIDESNNLQGPMINYNICTKGYNHLT